MFAVIYRVSVDPKREEEFRENWKKVASFFVKERGALGSSLHRSSEGLWVAYSRWPSRSMRDASWPQEGSEIAAEFPQEIKEAILGLKDCALDEHPEICMDVLEDVDVLSVS